MLPITQRFKNSYSFLWYLSFFLLLSACSSGDSTLTTETEDKSGIPVPSVVSTALPDTGTLAAYIRVDDGERQAMTINNGMASITLNGLTVGEHTVTMEFEFVFDTDPDRPVMLASASKIINVGAGQNSLDFAENEYDTDGFDADGDGIPNLTELSNKTSPFAGIAVSPISGNTAEDGTTATFTVVLTSQPQQGTEVSIDISSSNPAEGTVNPQTLTFDDSNWNNPQEVTVTGEDDSLVDGDQVYSIDFAAAVSADSDFEGLQAPSLSVTNVDDDGGDNSMPLVSLSIDNPSIAEAGGVAAITATLNRRSSQAVTVALSANASSTATETATETQTVDYTFDNSITIPAGELSKTATITARDDTRYEAPETIVIDISAVTNGTESGTQQVTTTITDNDQPPVVTLSINTSTPLAEGDAPDSGGSANITASLNTEAGLPVTVHLAYSGTATAGDDYTKADSIIIPVGRTFAQAAITVIGDDDDEEPEETIFIDIDTVDNGVEITTQQVEAKIADDDVPVVEFTTEAQTVIESAGTVSLNVTLDQVGVADISLPYTVSASSTATGDGVDHDLSNGTLNITAGQSNTLLVANIIDDTLVEPGETLVVTLGSPSNATLGAVTTHTVTIENNDYTVGGAVTGYSGTGLVLQNNGGDNLLVEGNSFTFTTALNDGSDYSVTVLTQPAGLLCSATQSGGTISGANINSVAIDCQVPLNVSSTKPKTLTFSWPALAGVTGYRLLVNPDGTSGYTPVGTETTATSLDVEIPVHLSDWVNATYMLETYNGSTLISTSDPVSIVDVMINSIGYFKASNSGQRDEFGYSVALSADANTLAVGAYGDDSNAIGANCNGINVGDNNNNGIPDCQEDNSLNDSGAVYVFARINGTWVQQAFIKSSNTGGGYRFGYSVALSANGSKLAVGAHLENAVYVFERSGSTWAQQAYINASNAGTSDSFGLSVALSADGITLAVGALNEASNAMGVNCNGINAGDNNNNGIPDCQEDDSLAGSGAAYVFALSGGTWTQQAYIKASNTEGYDRFGVSVDLSGDGNTLAVGAYQEDGNSTGVNCNGINIGDNNNNGIPDCQEDISQLSGSGAVYIFFRSSGIWAQQAYIKASNTGASDWFGNSVALSTDGSTLAVGAYYEDSDAVGINCNGINVGDNNSNGIPDCQEDDTPLNSSGAVYIYAHSGGTWAQQAYLKASNVGASDFFGRSVALSDDGNTLAVGASLENSNAAGVNCVGGISECQNDDSLSGSGAVYVFVRTVGTWSQQAYVKASNPGELDYFGWSVALSANGNVLAVGAVGEDSNAIGINGNQTDDCGTATPVNCATDSGAVYLY